MTKLIDISGQNHGRLTVISRAANASSGNARWVCRCECGQETTVRGDNLQGGATRRCGCLNAERRIESSTERSTTHGLTGTSTYVTWAHVIQRCTNSNHKQYADYGGRGIAVCERWTSFANFYADMGERPPGKSIDRIDNDKGYSPGNCRWATAKEQQANRRKRKPRSKSEEAGA